MKKLLLLLILAACVLSPAAFAQTTTTITGTVKDLSNAAVTSGQVSFTLQPGIDTAMSGTARFTPSEIDCTITGVGAVKALDGVSTCTVVNNTALQPSGTSYRVCIQPQFIQPGSCFVWYATGTATDITQQVPTPPLTPAYNLVDTFSNQTIGGNKTFSGNVVFSSNLTLGNFTAAGTFNASNGGALSGTFTGNPVFSGAVTAQGANLLNAKTLEGIRFSDQFGTGSTGINLAENDLSTTNGLVWVPGTVACGAGQNLALKDNIFVFDFRTCSSAQQQATNLLFNVKDTNNGAVRDKMMLVDPFTPTNVMSASSSSASLYAHTFLEGNLATFATLEAFNATITVDTGATNSPAVVAGIEGEASVSGTVANTLADVRGGTFNVGLSGAGSATTAASIVGQTITNTGTGTLANAFSMIAENQTIGTSINGGIWNKGTGVNDKPVSYGSLGSGIVPQAAIMLFVRPVSGQLVGGSQIGEQLAPVCGSDSTTLCEGLRSRFDTTAAVYTVPTGSAIHITEGTKGAGSTITTEVGEDIDTLSNGTTNYAIRTGANQSLFGGIVRTANKVFVASDFTTANNTSLQTITGLSWTFPAVSANYSFHCSLLYSQATAAVADQFGIQAATNSPTNIQSSGIVYTSTTASTAGNIATLGTTTATPFVTFTPSATATNLVAILEGTFELPASANTINIMVQTSAGADAVTVKRGSYCSLY